MKIKKYLLFLSLIFAALFFTSQNAFGGGGGYGYPSNGNTADIYSVINSFNLYYSEDYMHYAEYNGSGTYQNPLYPVGQTLDNEHANLPGFGMTLEGAWPNLPIWFEGNFLTNTGNSSYSEPSGNYTDHLQYVDGGIRVGYVILPTQNLAVIPNIGYEWVNWNRSLNPSLSAPSYSNYVEHYKLAYYMLGVKAYGLITPRFWIEAEAYYTHGNQNAMHTALSGTSFNFNLGNESGYLFGAKLGYELYKSETFQISPFVGIRYAQNKEGQSNQIPVPGGIISEPADQYNQLWLDFGLKFGFQI